MYSKWFEINVRQLIKNNPIINYFFTKGTVVEFIPPPGKHIVKICGTYLILHLKSGFCYVGSARDLYTRRIQHSFLLSRNNHFSRKFQTAFNDDQKIVIFFIPKSDREIAFSIEQDVLDMFLKSGHLFNTASNSRLVMENAIVSEETRKKLSVAGKGKIQDSDWIKKRTAYLIGRTVPAETIEKIRQKALERGIDPRMTILAKEKMSKPLIAGGVKFGSIIDAAKHFSISGSSAKKRILSLNPLFKDWYFLPPNI